MKKTLLILAVFLWSGLQLALAQGRVVAGKVVDADGQAVEAASVSTSDQTASTLTEADGSFSIEVANNDVKLVVTTPNGDQTFEVSEGNEPMELRLNQVSEVVILTSPLANNTAGPGTSRVGAKSFSDKPTASFTNMLQGQAAGVSVTATNGAPGAAAYIRIRGTSSINGGLEPLYVVDGVYVTGAALNSINQNDILNVSILKDASATAIYGSRGTNGVIVVTTKRGKNTADGKPTISYGFQYGWRKKTKDKYDIMNFDQKLQWERDNGLPNQYVSDLMQADGQDPEAIGGFTNEEMAKYWDQLRKYETDWMSEKKGKNYLLRIGSFQQHDLSVSGTSGNVSYRLSGQIYDEDGIAKSSFFSRKTGALVIDYKAAKWLKVGNNIRAAYSTTRNLRDRNNVQNPFAAMYQYNAYENPYDFTSNGYMGFNLTHAGFNVVEAMQNNPDFNKTTYILSSTYAEVKPIEDLTIRSQFGLNYTNFQGEYYLRPNSILDYYLYGGAGYKSDGTSNTMSYVWTNTAEYVKTLNEKHNLSALIGTEYTMNNSLAYSMSSKGYLSYGPAAQENGITPLSVSTSRSASTLMSYFAKLGYDYQGKYGIQGTVRRDGSSRFGADNLWGNFFSLGAHWMLSEEEFLRNVKALNLLKLWASFGTTGNNNIGNYTHRALLGITAYDQTPAVLPTSVGNPLLTWEKAQQFSIGFDYGFVNNRISGTIDYYNRKTYDLLLAVPIPNVSGFGTQTRNVGSVTNNGVEFNVNADIIRNGNFIWSVGGNFTYNKNKVNDLGNDDSIQSYSTIDAYYRVGHPLDEYFMPRWAGVDPGTGKGTWYMQDGSTTDEYATADYFVLKNKTPDPRYFGGFYTNLAYKGLELGINFSYSGGNWTYNQQWANLNSWARWDDNQSTEMQDFWTPENPNAKNPAFDINDNIYSSDRWLEKADFIRLRNVTLSYNFPTKWFDNKIQGLRVFVQGQNLWYYAPNFHGDPEVGIGSDENNLTRPGAITLYSYPQSGAVTVGLNVNF